jgi:hypothetical protein
MTAVVTTNLTQTFKQALVLTATGQRILTLALLSFMAMC